MKCVCSKIRRFVRAMVSDERLLRAGDSGRCGRILPVVMTVLLIGGVLFGSRQIAGMTADTWVFAAGEKRTESGESVMAERVEDTCTVVVDAGHGGADGGKVSPDGVVESEINLAIALKLRDALCARGVTVIMTRETDASLDLPSDRKHKAADLKRRVEIMNDSGADLVVSIHQNSFSDPKVHGAQVFYYEGSESGKAYAEAIQQDIATYVEPDNRRQAKGNGTYYILKKTSIPTVIVECGFLSNAEDTKKLVTEEYQQLFAEELSASVCRVLKIGDEKVALFSY